MKIPYSYLDREFENFDMNLLSNTIKNGDFTRGHQVIQFQNKLSQYLGNCYALGVGNGTDALEIALHTIKKYYSHNREKNEIIVPANTFIASISAIVREGLVPVLCDVNMSNVIDPLKIEKLITRKTLAILPVHFQGQPCDMPLIVELADMYNITIIEDAAQALDASHSGVLCGNWGTIGCFSFHPQKNLNCLGDGGAITTYREEIYDYMLKYSNHGMVNRDTYTMFGRNSRLDSIHAAYLNHRLPELHANNNKRIRIAQQYDEAFRGLPEISVPERSRLERHTYHLYIISVLRRDVLLEYLTENGIEAKIHYPKPLHLQECSKFLGYEKGDFPITERLCEISISLPIHQYMSDQEVNFVTNTILDFYDA